MPTPGADAGFHIFNGDGTGTDIVTFRINAVTVLENQAVPISYTVNADCTGRYTTLVPGGPSFNLFIAPDGESIAVIAREIQATICRALIKGCQRSRLVC